jgi:uncharacterized protein YjbI with pentapeptide repeats
VAAHDLIQAPDLPELEAQPLPSTAADGDGELSLIGALVAPEPGAVVRARRVRVRESELRGVTLEAENAPGLDLLDVILRDCDLSNVDGREGSIARVRVERSRLVGFGLSGGRARDLTIADSTLQLASFAHAGLQRVVFERVNLAEASFMEARLDAVAFIDCRMTGADFRGARLNRCELRGSSLDDVLGVESLRGLRMPWGDIVASAGAMAATLGIVVADD